MNIKKSKKSFIKKLMKAFKLEMNNTLKQLINIQNNNDHSSFFNVILKI